MAIYNLTLEQRQRFDDAEARALRGECPACLGHCHCSPGCLRADEMRWFSEQKAATPSED